MSGIEHPAHREADQIQSVTAGAGNTGLFAFFGEMTGVEKLTFWACFAGWTLDAADFMIYPLVIGTLLPLWHVERGFAGLAVTVTLLCSAVGGWLPASSPIASAGFECSRLPWPGLRGSPCFAPLPRITASFLRLAHYSALALAANGRPVQC